MKEGSVYFDEDDEMQCWAYFDDDNNEMQGSAYFDDEMVKCRAVLILKMMQHTVVLIFINY